MSRIPRVKFYLEKRIDKTTKKLIETDVPIVFSLSYGSRFKSSTGYRTDSKLWDQGKMKLKASHTHAAQINRQLLDLKKELEDICYNAWSDKKTLSPAYISSKMSKNQHSKKGFFAHFDEFIEQGKKKWQNNTVKKFTTIKNHLEEFSEKTRFRMEYDALDKKFLQQLIDYYFDEKKYINSYVRKNVRFIQQFLIWATDQGYNINESFRKWKVETGTKKETNADNIISLSPTEFFKIYNKNVTTERLQRAKDYLTLACFTGLRWSDVANLKKSDIDYKAGIISITTIKTGDKAIIPFNDFSREVLLKYRNTPNYNKNGIEMAFPVVSGQKMNVALKDMAEKAELTDLVTIVKQKRNQRIETVLPKYKLLSTHIGRKTFITLSVLLEIQSEVTMGLTTHHSHETMEKYYSVNMDMKRNAMKKFNKVNLKKYAEKSTN
jgi:integrase